MRGGPVSRTRSTAPPAPRYGMPMIHAQECGRTPQVFPSSLPRGSWHRINHRLLIPISPRPSQVPSASSGLPATLALALALGTPLAPPSAAATFRVTAEGGAPARYGRVAAGSCKRMSDRRRNGPGQPRNCTAKARQLLWRGSLGQRGALPVRRPPRRSDAPSIKYHCVARIREYMHIL